VKEDREESNPQFAGELDRLLPQDSEVFTAVLTLKESMKDFLFKVFFTSTQQQGMGPDPNNFVKKNTEKLGQMAAKQLKLARHCGQGSLLRDVYLAWNIMIDLNAWQGSFLQFGVFYDFYRAGGLQRLVDLFEWLLRVGQEVNSKP